MEIPKDYSRVHGVRFVEKMELLLSPQRYTASTPKVGNMFGKEPE
jgi:hypothetical protein